MPERVLQTLVATILLVPGCSDLGQEAASRTDSAAADSAAAIDRAGALYFDGRPGEALELLDGLARDADLTAAARRLAARCCTARGRHDEAAARLATILERDPFDTDACEALARNRFRLGRDAEGEMLIDAASRLDSRAARRQGPPANHAGRPSAPLLRRAMILADRGRPREALLAFEEARNVATHPTALLLGSLGSMYARIHRNREAAPLLRACLESDGGRRLPAAPLLRRQLASVIARLDADDPVRALAAIRRLGETAGGDGERLAFDLHVVGLLLDPLDLPERAADLLAEIAAHAGARPRILELALELALRFERREKAFALITQLNPTDTLARGVSRVIQRHPALAEAWLLLAELQRRDGNTARARGARDRATALRHLREERRELLRDIGTTQGAAAGSLYLRLALNLHGCGLDDGARWVLELARSLSPDRADVHRAYHEIRDRPGEVFFRIRAWRDIARLAPEDTAARESLRQTRAGLGLTGPGGGVE